MSTSAQKLPSEWVERLGREDEAAVARARRKLVEQLGDDSTRDEAARALLAEVRREDAKARREALALLCGSWWPPSPELSAEGLESILLGFAYLEPEGSAEMDAAAILLTALLHQAPPGKLAAFREALDHPWYAVRWAALSTLARLELSPEWLPRFEKLLEDEHPEIRGAALEVIESQASVDPSFSAPLLLAHAVANGGSARFSALAAVRVLLDAESPPDAMRRLKDPSEVLKLLEDESAPIRMQTLYVLQLLGRSDEATLQAVRTLLRDPIPDVVANAAATLLRLVKDDAQAIGTLGTMLCSPSERDAGAAIVALDLAGPRVLRRAGPALELALKRAPLAEVKNDLRRLLAKRKDSQAG